jgi:hypothetical protein
MGCYPTPGNIFRRFTPTIESAAFAVVAREPGTGSEAGEGVPFAEGFCKVLMVGLHPIAKSQPIAEHITCAKHNDAG